MSLPGVAQPLVGSEPAGRQRACSLWSMKLVQLRAWCGKKHGNSIKTAKKDNKGQWTKKLTSSVRYDYMSRAELAACCGKKHGNSITVKKKDNEGRWKSKSKKELMSELKNAAMLRSKSGGSKQGFAALFSKQARSRQSIPDSGDYQPPGHLVLSRGADCDS